MSKPSWLITDSNITVNFDGQTHTLARTSDLADKVIAAIKAKDFEKIPSLISSAKAIENGTNGTFKVENGCIILDGIPVPEVLGKKIMRFVDEGLPYEPLVNFAKNLQQNPSYRSVQQLFSFLEVNDHPITEDGCFIAYKKVRSDYKDYHSGTMDNSVGKKVEMPRNQVNEDPNQTCSEGLHCSNWDYANNHYCPGFSDAIMLEVVVNPRDVVAVPVDYNQAKMRVCEYVVLGKVDCENSTTPLRVINPVVSDLEDDEDFDDEEYEDDEEYDECENCLEEKEFCCCVDDQDEDEDEDEYECDEEDEYDCCKDGDECDCCKDKTNKVNPNNHFAALQKAILEAPGLSPLTQDVLDMACTMPPMTQYEICTVEDECVICPVGNYFSVVFGNAHSNIDFQHSLSNDKILKTTFVSSDNYVTLDPANGVINIPKPTKLNYSTRSNETLNAIQLYVSYSYLKPRDVQDTCQQVCATCEGCQKSSFDDE